MKATVKIKKEIDVRYLKVDAGVRYWEDADVNGKKDIDLYKTKGAGSPRIPFAMPVKSNPTSNIYSDHFRWRPVIDVEKGCIVDWPKGTTAHIHYKVCDDGVYALLDEDWQTIISVESYVPDCIGEDGDYIIMDIDEDGNIADWSFDESDVTQIIRGAFDYDYD